MKFPLADDHTELDALLEKAFAALDEENIEAIYNSLDFFWARLAMHIRAEHLHLFPAIIKAIETKKENEHFPSLTEARKALKDLQDDHNFFMRELSAMIKLLRERRENEGINGFSMEIADVRFKLSSVKKRLETHNQIEETEVYKWLNPFLSSPERDVLDERMQREIANVPPRFDKIYAV